MKKIKLNTLKLYMSIMNDLAKEHGCKIKWNLRDGEAGSFNVLSGTIYLHAALIYNEEDLWSTFFHELTHARCIFLKKYMKFHNPYCLDFEYKDRIKLRAERYVEREAAKLMKIYFPILEYKYSY